MNLLDKEIEDSDVLVDDMKDFHSGGSYHIDPNISFIKEDDKNIEELKDGNIMKVLITIGIPSMVGLFTFSYCNAGNSMIIGSYLGDDFLAGYSNFLPTENLFFSQTVISMIQGACAVISNFLGQQDLNSSSQALAHVLMLCAVHAFIIPVILLPWLSTYLCILGVTNNIIPYSMQYGFLATLLLPLVYTTSQTSAILRCINKAYLSMARQIVGSLLNIIFVFVSIRCIKLNSLMPVAVSTISANAISGIWILIYFFSKKSTIRLRLKSFKISKNIIRQIYLLSLPTYIQFVPVSLQSLITPIILRNYSDSQENAIKYQLIAGISNRIVTMINQPLTGLIGGVQPLLGYAIGAKNWGRASEIIYKSLLLLSVVSIIMWLIIMIFAHQLVKLFSKSVQYYQEASFLLRINYSGLLFSIILQFTTVLLQQQRRAKVAIYCQLCRAFVSLIFQIVLPIATKQAKYMFYSQVIGDVVGGVLGVYFLYYIIKNFKNIKKQQINILVDMLKQ